MQSAVDDFLKNEELEYTCAKCGHSRSEVTHKFSRLPRYLIGPSVTVGVDFPGTW